MSRGLNVMPSWRRVGCAPPSDRDLLDKVDPFTVQPSSIATPTLLAHDDGSRDPLPPLAAGEHFSVEVNPDALD